MEATVWEDLVEDLVEEEGVEVAGLKKDVILWSGGRGVGSMISAGRGRGKKERRRR